MASLQFPLHIFKRFVIVEACLHSYFFSLDVFEEVLDDLFGSSQLDFSRLFLKALGDQFAESLISLVV